MLRSLLFHPTVMNFSQFMKASNQNICIAEVRRIHGQILTSGLCPDVYMNNRLASMYVKYDRMRDAHNVFDRMLDRNLASWAILISGYSKTGLSEEALGCFKEMVNDGLSPNDYTYVGAISACSTICAARTGKEIHGHIYRITGKFNTYVSNALVSMYGRCGLLNLAQIVFNAILDPAPVTWSSILSSYCQHKKYVQGLKAFMQFRKAGLALDEFSCTSVFVACAALESVKTGMQLHTLVIKCGHVSDQFVVTSLINFYVKCKTLDSAHKALLEIDEPIIPAWTALIGGFAQNGEERKSLCLFVKLHSSGLKPNDRTLSSVLGVDALETNSGAQLHSLIIKLGFFSHTMVGNAVLGFYAKGGLLNESARIFDEIDKHDIVSWNALILCHVRSRHHKKASEVLNCMLTGGFKPSPHTYSSILSICGDVPSIGWGKQTHCCILKPGFSSDVVVGSALIDMYTKCGRLGDAQKIFDNLTSRNVVSWNSMIVGYAQHGSGRDALNIYSMMRRHGVKPNGITFLGILTACAHMGLLEEGWHHYNSMIKEHGITPKTDHLACMVSLFGRKGLTKRAYEFILDSVAGQDKVVWRCLLSACKTYNDLHLGRLAAEKILSIDKEDTSAHVALSNIYAEARMWKETAKIRKVIKERELKKDVGYSWTELKNTVYFFTSCSTLHFIGSDLHAVLNGLVAQLFDEGYKPDANSFKGVMKDINMM